MENRAWRTGHGEGAGACPHSPQQRSHAIPCHLHGPPERGAAPVTALKCGGRGSSSGPGPSLPAFPRPHREPSPGTGSTAGTTPVCCPRMQQQVPGSAPWFGKGCFFRKRLVVHLGKERKGFVQRVGDALCRLAAYSSWNRGSQSHLRPPGIRANRQIRCLSC